MKPCLRFAPLIVAACPRPAHAETIPSPTPGVWMQLIARGDDPAPGRPAGAIYSSLAPHSINNNGEVAYRVNAAVPPSFSGLVVLYQGPYYDPQPVLVGGDPMPGFTDGTTFNNIAFQSFPLNDAGQMVFDARYRRPDGAFEHGLWHGTPQTLAPFIKEGDVVPIDLSGTLAAVGTAIPNGKWVLSENGELLLNAITDPSVQQGTTDAIWIGTPGDFQVVAGENDLVPDGDPLNPLRYWFGTGSISRSLSIFDDGQTLIRALYTQNDSVLLRGFPGSLQRVAIVNGSVTPGGNSRTFNLLSAGSNGVDAIYRITKETFDAMGGSNHDSFFISNPAAGGGGTIRSEHPFTYGAESMMALSSSGLGANVIRPFGGCAPAPCIPEVALVYGPPLAMATLISTSDPIPDRPGLFFGQQSGSRYATVEQLYLNDNGDLAIRCLVRDAAGLAAGRAVLAMDETGALRTMLATGDVIEIRPGEFRTIIDVNTVLSGGGSPSATGGSDGRASAWNNNREMIISFRWTLSGNDVANVVARFCEPPSVTAQPLGATPNEDSQAVLSVSAQSGTPLSYQWRRDGVDLLDGFTPEGSFISGATTATLTIDTMDRNDTGLFDCLITNPCATERSAAAAVVVTINPCPGDANDDGIVDFADITDVVANWLNDYTQTLLGTGPGDANLDGLVNFADITSTVANWLMVCP